MPKNATEQASSPTVHPCWIDGQAVYGDTTYPLINPSTGRSFAQATMADATLVDSALAAAQSSFPNWRAASAAFRTDLLCALANLIREHQAWFAKTLCDEVGKPIGAARDEVSNAAHLMDYFAQESLRLSGRIPLLGYPREQVMIVREPVGVVAAITPYNYPLSTLVCKMAPALAVGCTVVAKPDEHTPITAIRLAQLASEAGLPNGVFSVVTGFGPETGRLLVEHPTPRLIAFTGSTEVGKEIQAVSARWVRKVVSELGGHCPAIVCADAPWRELVSSMVCQSFRNCGQYCYRISRIYVDRQIYDEFLTEFMAATGRLRVGPAPDPETDLGPMNNAMALSHLQNQIAQARAEGARVRLGGAPADLPSGGFYYLPTVLTDVTPEMRIAREEVFGPAVVISPFADPRTAIEEANGSPYGLGAYLFTADLARAMEWAGQLEAGSVWVNRIHQAYPEAPFGGMKESGLGREKSRFGIEEYTELKTIYLSY
ncbi:aldehyde dehydrogenase family protein [Desulfoferrobacter suflitae]|uniref:aldehyde dehydrogenase family protein n=1 Tax=Desulfoferrobacter suflitae TaxID=2865782 RepID=UPI002164929D|nr:aldehyde dehydrogenase family protein [Desulfoferrobacter suflitae]MCK8603250.1 aldehyde dehydrogenase family protein [Desulfoferrobacter suflitae]